jgi:hypothetical protein
VVQVCRELKSRGIRFQPSFYLSDSWGCPDRVPAVGVPFYLADRRLARIEEEQTGEIEDRRTIRMFLRHEVGHAINYAYCLWERDGWTEAFGPFQQPYRDAFTPDRRSREFVRHLVHGTHGQYYAQKHPDEDFAETFAVWLTPGSGWRRAYRFWPALQKLEYVARLMSAICRESPRCQEGTLANPVELLTMSLAEHYGQKVERYRALAQGYVDDKLREAFPAVRTSRAVPAAELIRKHHPDLCATICRWSDLTRKDVDAILDKLEERAGVLHLEYARSKSPAKLAELSSLATALAMDFLYTGRFVG